MQPLTAAKGRRTSRQAGTPCITLQPCIIPQLSCLERTCCFEDFMTRTPAEPPSVRYCATQTPPSSRPGAVFARTECARSVDTKIPVRRAQNSVVNQKKVRGALELCMSVWLCNKECPSRQRVVCGWLRKQDGEESPGNIETKG